MDKDLNDFKALLVKIYGKDADKAGAELMRVGWQVMKNILERETAR